MQSDDLLPQPPTEKSSLPFPDPCTQDHFFHLKQKQPAMPQHRAMPNLSINHKLCLQAHALPLAQFSKNCAKRMESGHLNLVQHLQRGLTLCPRNLYEAKTPLNSEPSCYSWTCPHSGIVRESLGAPLHYQ